MRTLHLISPLPLRCNSGLFEFSNFVCFYGTKKNILVLFFNLLTVIINTTRLHKKLLKTKHIHLLNVSIIGFLKQTLFPIIICWYNPKDLRIIVCTKINVSVFIDSRWKQVDDMIYIHLNMYTICVILQFHVHKVNVYLSSDKTVSALMTFLLKPKHYKSNELIDTYNVEI